MVSKVDEYYDKMENYQLIAIRYNLIAENLKSKEDKEETENSSD